MDTKTMATQISQEAVVFHEATIPNTRETQYTRLTGSLKWRQNHQRATACKSTVSDP